jgi:redox-sensing transcriptional repressor
MKAIKNYITRLHEYRNALYRFKQMGFVKVFSDNLADAVGVTASQVRRDLSIYGLASGNKRGGYQTDELLRRFNEVLGKNNPQNVIVVGAGNIGRALMGYKGFEKENIKIVAAFESDASKVDRKASIPVLPLEEMGAFVKAHNVEIGVIAVPDIFAQTVIDLMFAAGVKGALNFAPIRLKVPEGFIVNDVNLGVELETVVYSVNALNNRERTKKKAKP